MGTNNWAPNSPGGKLQKDLLHCARGLLSSAGTEWAQLAHLHPGSLLHHRTNVPRAVLSAAVAWCVNRTPPWTAWWKEALSMPFGWADAGSQAGMATQLYAVGTIHKLSREQGGELLPLTRAWLDQFFALLCLGAADVPRGHTESGRLYLGPGPGLSWPLGGAEDVDSMDQLSWAYANAIGVSAHSPGLALGTEWGYQMQQELSPRWRVALPPDLRQLSAGGVLDRLSRVCGLVRLPLPPARIIRTTSGVISAATAAQSIENLVAIRLDRVGGSNHARRDQLVQRLHPGEVWVEYSPNPRIIMAGFKGYSDASLRFPGGRVLYDVELGSAGAVPLYDNKGTDFRPVTTPRLPQWASDLGAKLDGLTVEKIGVDKRKQLVEEIRAGINEQAVNA